MRIVAITGHPLEVAPRVAVEDDAPHNSSSGVNASRRRGAGVVDRFAQLRLRGGVEIKTERSAQFAKLRPRDDALLRYPVFVDDDLLLDRGHGAAISRSSDAPYSEILEPTPSPPN